MKKRLTFQFALTLEALAMAGAVYFLGMFFYIALSRIGYPYELEWMEGGSVDHVRRVLAGLPLYVRPSLDFTPFIYNPLFYYLAALFSRLMGTGFFPLRLLSLLATAGCFSLIYLLVKRETGRPMLGIIGAGLFASAFLLCGAWYDLGRPDMLFLLLILASACTLRFSESGRGAVFAGLLAFLAFAAKQNALPMGILLAVYAILKGKDRQRWIFALVFFGLAVLWTGAFQIATDGWYVYYIFTLPGQHVIHYDMLPSVLWDDIARHIPLLLLLAVVYVLYRLWSCRDSNSLFHLILAGGLGALSVAARMHSGGYSNALIPLYAAVSIYAAMAFSIPFHLTESNSVDHIADGQANSHFTKLADYLPLLLVLLLFPAMLWQFQKLKYNPYDQIPTIEDRAAGDAFVQLIQSIDGEVFVPYHGYLPALAGKRTYAQGMALEDVFRGTNETLRDELKNEIREAIEERRFSAIILDGEWRFMEEIKQNYSPEALEYDGDTFVPVTGMPARPALLYRVNR